MRPGIGLALAVGLTCQTAPVGAQDLIGFDRASFGNVVLSRNQSAGARDDVQLELSFGAYNNESIRNYSSDSVFSKMGRAVGRLDILTDNGIFPCTAFVVDKKYLLTNYHCVPGILDNEKAQATRIDAVQFVAGYVQQGVQDGTQTYTVSPTPVESDKDLDYALLEVLGDPSSKYGKLALSSREPRDGDPYWVIGHPMGEAQRISREKCRANVPALSNSRLLHTCDTLPGNSGSPVIDASLQQVVGLHHAGSKKDSVNFAIPMQLILARSAYLTAALGDTSRDPAPGGPAVTPPPSGPSVQVGETGGTDICDELYAEAKAYAACFAYRAYESSCTDHPYVGFASAYIEDNCGGTEPEDDPVDVVTNPPYTPPAQPAAPLRPWCTSSRLNPTESTICSHAYLAALDAELDTAYRQNKHKPVAKNQASWLRNSRNACGTKTWCIETEYEKRIAALKSGVEPNTGTQQSYQLPSHQCYIVVASRTSVQEARQFIHDRLSSSDGVRVFQSDNGYYGITVATVNRSEADWRLSQLKSQNRIPGDSFCSGGSRYIREIAWQSGSTPSPSPSPGPSTLYVDNNNDGGLNLRSGPGTNYPITYEMGAGMKVTQLRTDGGWSNLRLPDGRTGWASTRYLTYSKPTVRICNGQVRGLRPASTYSPSNGSTFLWMRSSPSTSNGKPLAELYQGDRVRVVAQRNGWARVQCVSGQCTNPYRGSAGVIGWSSQKYLNIWCN